MLLVSNKNYYSIVKKTAKSVSSMNKRICYVSLNKPYETLSRDFKKESINLKKFFFIDCISKKRKEEGQVIYVSSPKALTEINIVMKKVIKTGKIESTIFDSLSTLMVYEGSSSVVRFAHSIVSMFRETGSKGILISLRGDMKTDIIKDLNMFVDDVVEVN